MSYTINSQQARAKARQDLTIFREINSIMEQIINDAGNGLYETVISDSTEMTESTPTITVTGTVSNPTVTAGETFILNGTTVTLGTTGTNLNSIIADINDANLTGIVASKSDNKLVIVFTAPQSSTWQLAIGAGTANANLGFINNTNIVATNPSSVTFFSTWQGTTTDRAKQDQMNQVISYFEGLGYTIDRSTNTSTNKTFKWTVSY